MEKVIFNVPAMYADHHVIEVRKLISELPGVEYIYASSGFNVVEITFDGEKLKANEIERVLDQVGYLDELSLPVETGAAAYLADDSPSYFRHTQVFETSKDSVGFAQNVSYSGRPLWNCPGIGVIKTTMED